LVNKGGKISEQKRDFSNEPELVALAYRSAKLPVIIGSGLLGGGKRVKKSRKKISSRRRSTCQTAGLV